MTRTPASDEIQCEHRAADAVRFACVHLLASRELHRVYHRRFTGEGMVFDLVCTACAEHPELRAVCSDCFGRMLNGQRQIDLGAPAHRSRATELRFTHTLVRPRGVLPVSIIAQAPAANLPGIWFVLDSAGTIHRVDLERGVIEGGGALPAYLLALDRPVDLHVAPDGSLVAVAERDGRNAVVIEPATGMQTLTLRRDDYHEEHCRFPLGFFELDGRLLLVHAVAWNRLEVSDPRTGALLTARDPMRYERGEPQPEHYLDYFHAGLVISPDGTRVIDNGWVWHPYGVVRTFRLDRWVGDNAFESEDGPSVKDLVGRSYFWDGPVCWLDARTVAVWGDGEDEEELTPAALIFDVETGERLRAFPGPIGSFAFDAPFLVAHDRLRGATVWDVETGEQVAEDSTLRPDGYHPASRCFVQWIAGEGFRVSRRVSIGATS